MRTKAMERFGETRKLKDEDNVSEKKKIGKTKKQFRHTYFSKRKVRI